MSAKKKELNTDAMVNEFTSELHSSNQQVHKYTKPQVDKWTNQ